MDASGSADRDPGGDDRKRYSGKNAGITIDQSCILNSFRYFAVLAEK